MMDKQREKFEKWISASRRYDVDVFRRTQAGAEALQNALDDDYIVWQAVQRQAVPDGYVLLPVELTEDMRAVLTEMLTNCHSVDESYQDLLNAAKGGKNN